MPDEIILPVPELFTTEIINLGPVIDPPFSDARDLSQFLTSVETRSIDFEQRDSMITEEHAGQAVELALVSEDVIAELQGKRYEIMGVGTKSLDRDTDHPLVVIYNYTDDVVLEASVDLDGTTLLDVTLERYQPPLAASEEGQARDLVRQDGRLADTGTDVATGRGIVVDDENFRSPRYRHRLVDLRFGPEDRRLPTAWAIVDLTDQEVVKTGIIPQEESS